MLTAIKTELVLKEVKVTVAGLKLNEQDVGETVCFCSPEGEIKYISCPFVGSPFVDANLFGKDQAKHIRTLCKGVCERSHV